MKDTEMKNHSRTLAALPLLLALILATPAQAEPHDHEKSTAAAAHDDDDHSDDDHSGGEHAAPAPGEKGTGHDHDEEGEDSHEAETEAGEDGHGHEEKESSALSIDPEAAAEMGIRIATAGAGVIAQTTAVTGRVVLNKNAIAEVQGRFQGIVKSVTRTEGETVAAGETLATVESNESLQVYPVKSSIGGIILTRNTNIGHITNDEAMFVIADMSQLWVEFNIFPKDAAKIAAGQEIRLTPAHGGDAAYITISAILPVADSTSQTVIARGVIDNADGTWRPGMALRGDILTAQIPAAVVVRKSAIQRLEGAPVVFVKKDGKFEPRNVTLGETDNDNAEILDGVRSGESYAVTGSFVLKAHAGKAGAEHAH